MKNSNLIKYFVSLILLIQLLLSSFTLYKKASMTNDDSLPVLELKVSVPFLYKKGNNHLSISEVIKFVYNHEENPIVEKLEFTKKTGDRTTTSQYYSIDAKTIYLPLKKEGDTLSLNGYSTKKPSEGFFLEASLRGFSKPLNQDEVTISPEIKNLKRFNFEGDKWDSIEKYLAKVRSFNSKLDRELREKKITKEEANSQRKKAHVKLRVDQNGNYFVLDYVVDGKSIKNDF